MSEHRLEVADVFRIHEDDFLAQWGHVLSRRRVSTTLRHSEVEFSEYSRLSFVVC
jgi:hypothetical protein